MAKAPRLLFLALFLVALLLPAGLSPLVESTEARYGEIAREMLVSGNYLEPFFNGIKHFHKPPLAYWGVAAGMKLFGVGDFGARFFGMVAAVVAVGYFYRLARLLLEDEGKGLAATLIFSTSLLLLGTARIVSTEIYLTCFTIQAQFYLFRQVYGQRSARNALFYAVALALGFLTKGPIIFLFTLLPYVIAKFFDPRHRRVFPVRDLVLAGLVFCALTLPWYLLVMVKNPGLLHYFLKVQTVDRVVTDRFKRYQPPWYFLAVFSATFLPYLCFFGKALSRPRDLPDRLKTLLVYLGIPFLVFSLAKGKHATYILPLYGVAALFAAEAHHRYAMPRLRALTLVLAGLLAVAPAAAIFFVKPLPPFWIAAIFATTPFSAWMIWKAWGSRGSAGFLGWIAGMMLLFGTAGYVLFGFSSHRQRGVERLVERINSLDPQRTLPVVVFQKFLPSVSFYRGELAVMAFGDSRETQFEADESYRSHYLESPGELRLFRHDHPDIFLVAERGDRSSFESDYAFSCDEIFSQRKVSAFRCHATVAAD